MSKSIHPNLTKWKGRFNYKGEVWEGHTFAKTENVAFYKLLSGMSKKFETSVYRLSNYFLSEGHYEIYRES